MEAAAAGPEAPLSPHSAAAVGGDPAWGAPASSSARGGAGQAEMATEAARLMLGKAGEWKGAVGVMRTNVPRNIKALQHKERFLRLADGALQFYDKPKDSAPQRQDLVRAIKSIRWSGIEVSTPLETFRMYLSGNDAGEAREEATHRLFHALGEYFEAKKEAEAPELHNVFAETPGLEGCMQVGELGEGRVLYRPAEGAQGDHERDNDVLRLSIAIRLVEEEALKQRLNFEGWVQKSSREGAGSRNKERYLKVCDGHLYFHDDTKSAKPRKMIGVETIKDLKLWQLTVETEYDTFKLCNTSKDPAALGKLYPHLQAAHQLIRGDVLTNMSAAFDEFDKDGDGGLSREEMARILGDQRAVEQFFREIDVDADGTITRAEFMQHLERRNQTLTGADGKVQRITDATDGAAAADDMMLAVRRATAPEEAVPPTASVSAAGAGAFQVEMPDAQGPPYEPRSLDC